MEYRLEDAVLTRTEPQKEYFFMFRGILTAYPVLESQVDEMPIPGTNVTVLFNDNNTLYGARRNYDGEVFLDETDNLPPNEKKRC